MEAASAHSAAAEPHPLSRARPTAHPDPGSGTGLLPMAMTIAELEAAIAALPAKKVALCQAFDRLAACSPLPLPFAWDDLDAHISSLQSSISLRFRQLRVLEAVRPAPSVAAPATTRDDDNEKGKNQGGEELSEEEEEEEEDEEEEEAEEEEQVTEEAKEEDDEVVVVVVEEEEEEEVEEEEEEEDFDAHDAADKQEQKADEEMQEADEEVMAKEQELEANDNASDKDLKAGKEAKAKGEQQEAKNVSPEQFIQEEKAEANVPQKQGYPALQGADKDFMVACTRMDATKLVKIMCKNISGWQKYHVAMGYAPDAAGLVLRVVRDFLPRKKPKTNKVWENCVKLIRCVPVVTPKLPVQMMEQAKQLAKDWKKMVDKPGSCEDLGMLASWALLYFLISYNIVSEFDVDEIIRLFGTVPRKYQKKNCAALFKGLGLDSRITDLIDYLIRNGQHLSAVQITRVLNLVDKYPMLSVLEGYIENAKRTALELLSKNASHKSLNPAISKEVENLWLAHTMVKQQRSHSSQWSVILAEIKNLIAEYTKKRSLNASTASTSNVQQQQQQKQKPHDEQQKQKQKNKKRKNEQDQHEGQYSQLQGKHRKLQGKQEQQQTNPQKKQQQQHKPQESKGQQQHKPQENKGQQQHKPQEKQQKQQQNAPQQRLQQPLTRPCVPKLPQPVVPATGVLPPAVPNMAQIGLLGHPPVHNYPAQPGLPGIQAGAFTANVGNPQYNPYQQNPLYRHPSFYSR